MARPELLPELIETSPKTGRYMAVIYNNDHTPYHAVISVLIAATKCDYQEAEIETWEAHTYGQAAVHFATEAECRAAAKTIASIGVKTEVRKEWDD